MLDAGVAYVGFTIFLLLSENKIAHYSNQSILQHLRIVISNCVGNELNCENKGLKLKLVKF